MVNGKWLMINGARRSGFFAFALPTEACVGWKLGLREVRMNCCEWGCHLIVSESAGRKGGTTKPGSFIYEIPELQYPESYFYWGNNPQFLRVHTLVTDEASRKSGNKSICKR